MDRRNTYNYTVVIGTAGTNKKKLLSRSHFNVLPDEQIELSRTVADNVSQVAHEPIGELLIMNLVQDVAAFVVPQCPAQLLVVHGRFALVLAPQLGHGLRLAHHKFAVETSGPDGPPDHVSEMSWVRVLLKCREGIGICFSPCDIPSVTSKKSSKCL